MEIERNIVTGRVDDALPDVKSKLNGYLRNYDALYIGATSNPETRWRRKHDGDGWLKMVLLYETRWAGSTRSMERKLIAYAKSTNFRVKPDNIKPGGEMIDDGYEKYWVYILVKRD